MRQPALIACAVLAVLACAGCGSGDGEEGFRANPTKTEDPDDREVRLAIAALAKGGQPSDPESSVTYDKAVNELILRGVKIETRLIDALRSDPDPWVRFGCVEVLTAIATKASVEHLIAVLDDSEPLVAHRANKALEVLTGERMISVAGKPADKPLPAVPARPEGDKALDADQRMWAAWHAEHKAELKAAWERWWTANRADFKLK